MNLIQLEYFKKTVSAGGVSAAARKLFVSQPAVSKQLRLLEEEMETPLFFRRRRGLELTEAGKILYGRAGDILSLAKNLKDEIKSSAGRISGKIHAGCGYLTSRSIFPEILGRMLKNYPGVEISVFETDWEDMSQLLRKDEIDIGFGMEITDRDRRIKFEEVFSSGMVFVCSAKSPLARKKLISAEDIRRAPLITYYPESMIYKNLDKAYRISEGKIILHSKMTESIIAYAAENLGAGVIPEYIIKLKPYRGVAVRKLESGFRIKLGLNYDASKPLSPAVRAFIKTALELGSPYGKI
jgi:DNA-binding transcriptional LysR family regulator